LARFDLEVTGLRCTAPFETEAVPFGGTSCLLNDFLINSKDNFTVVVRVTVLVRSVVTPRVTLVPKVVSKVVYQRRVTTR